jgi:TadE-like protein
MRTLARRLRSERGDGLIEGLLVLGLVLFVVAVIVQTLLWAHARSIAEGAAQDGAHAAAIGGAGAGVARADTLLAASGGTGDGLHPRASVGETVVTVDVTGKAPHVFPLGFAVPAVHARASLPLERYPELERQP